MLNVFCICGQITEMPVLRETPGGTRITSLKVNVQRPFTNAEGIYEYDEVELEIWRGLAETVCSICEKDNWVTARGRIASRPYEKDGRRWMNYSFVTEKLEVIP